jgi:hypothetical protein
MNANCDGTATVRSGDDSQILYSEPYTWEPPIVFTGTGTLTSFVDIPEPWPLPEITYTLNLAPFWDIASINRAISIIQTFFLFDNVQKFFQIFVPFSGFIIALKWMVGTYRSRRARTLQAIEEQ